MKTLLMTVILLASHNLFAFEKEDSMMALRGALMDSNRDINQKTKVLLDRENQRIDQWSQRDLQLIEISNDIAVEAKKSDRAELKSDFEERTPEQPATSLQVTMNE